MGNPTGSQTSRVLFLRTILEHHSFVSKGIVIPIMYIKRSKLSKKIVKSTKTQNKFFCD
jgi:hypothetical protein